MAHRTMFLHKKIIEKANERFNKALVPGTAKFAPRPGYFYIRETFQKDVAPLRTIQVAIVNWKSDRASSFVEDVQFEIALSNLYADRPELLLDWRFEDLIGKTIYVYSAVILEKSFHGAMEKVLNCQWQLVEENPIFLNSKLAAIQSFFQGANNVQEALNNHVNNSEYNVLEAIDYEAQYGHQDDWLTGEIFDDDAPNAPEDEPVK